MRVCFATSECVPFSKTGGLGDVSGSLPKALARSGCEVKVFTPLYQSINTEKYNLVFCEDLYELPIQIGDTTIAANVWYGHLPDSTVDVYFIDCPHYFHRPSIYTSDADEGDRFIMLQKATFAIMQRYGWSPDIIHGNDWQTALMPAMARESFAWDDLFSSTATVLTIHNMAYRGIFSDASIYNAGLPYDQFFPGGAYELEGAFSFLKTGIVYADIITTVSPTYANEIQTPEMGYGLDPVLRSRASSVFGVLNGIDRSVWNPAADALIPTNYDAPTIDKKSDNKRAMLGRFGLTYSPEIPTLAMISRLTDQKGVELMQPILGPLLRQHRLQFVAIGSGESRYEDFLRWAAVTFPDRVGVYIGYNEELSHLVEAGADMFIMPSRFEPCGLNQMFSLNYGTVPIVRKTGGLADTVFDFHESNGVGNGFSFYDFTPHALQTSIERALALFNDRETWRTIQLRGMAADFSWETSAEKYIALYEAAAAARQVSA